MRVFVTIITAAFFAHWTSSLIGIRANGISNSDYPVISRESSNLENPLGCPGIFVNRSIFHKFREK